LDLYGRGFTLVRVGEDAPSGTALIAAAAAASVPLNVVQLTEEAVAETYGRRLVLVRPDGHVAWRGDDEPADAGALITLIRGGGPTTPGLTIPSPAVDRFSESLAGEGSPV